MSAMKVRGLTGGYTTSADVITQLDLDLNPGRAVGVIGRNGAGKTCLAQLLIGTARQRGGTIRVGDQEMSAMRPRGRIRAGLSLVPEGRMVFPQLTVRENLMVAAYGAGVPNAAKEVERVEKRFEILTRKANDRAGGMSGGEQQILAIGRALVQKPEVVILDEPSLGLAPVMINRLIQVLADVLADGPAVLLMEQNRHIVGELCDVVHVMAGGAIAASLTAEELHNATDLGALYLSA